MSKKISVFVSGGFEPLAKTIVKELYTRLDTDLIEQVRIGIFEGQMPLDIVRGGAQIARIIPSKKETIESALKGIDAAFIWRTENEDENLIFRYIDAILEQTYSDSEHNVKRLVVLSSYDSCPSLGKEIEEYLVNKSSSPSITILNVPIFVRHFELYINSIVNEKVLQLPIGVEGRFAPLDDRDFATVVANLLLTTTATNPTTNGTHSQETTKTNIKTITLTGPKLYTGPELAEKLSTIRKEEISFSGTSLNEAEVFLSNVLPSNSESLIKRYQELYRVIRDDDIGNHYNDYDLKKLLGDQQPRDVDAYFSEVFPKESARSVIQRRGF
ncbi:12932_t:CDS:2 [Ambispora gerdemannii]|uniref:12932_t:CDS:1 n=1 Tax=Ambispora gerdemannii TaxID=144530 RepID=A0A9N8WE84_9GLOM|nr:12932_t:CDS:2 [Ambispora gerdemannii]